MEGHRRRNRRLREQRERYSILMGHHRKKTTAQMGGFI